MCKGTIVAPCTHTQNDIMIYIILLTSFINCFLNFCSVLLSFIYTRSNWAPLICSLFHRVRSSPPTQRGAEEMGRWSHCDFVQIHPTTVQLKTKWGEKRKRRKERDTQAKRQCTMKLPFPLISFISTLKSQLFYTITHWLQKHHLFNWGFPWTLNIIKLKWEIQRYIL